MFLCQNKHISELLTLLQHYQLKIHTVAEQQNIPGSWFGEPEAGIIQNRLYVRSDTPVHSALHESCHYICMDQSRRKGLHTDAGGDYDEENGVCYLQILLADYLPFMNRKQMMTDMDDWGYTFRLGSAQRWFEEDAEDARLWLQRHGLIDQAGKPTWKLRQ